MGRLDRLSVFCDASRAIGYRQENPYGCIFILPQFLLYCNGTLFLSTESARCGGGAQCVMTFPSVPGGKAKSFQ
jgi:hypothetical protein